jgi:hypothetical protein
MFVPAGEVQAQWDEPYFFGFRTMGGRSLLLRALFFLGLCTVFSIALVSEPESVKSSRSFPEAVALVLLCAAVITVLVTAPSIQRRITLSRDGISWSNRYPASLILFLLSAGALSRLEMKRVVLQRPGDRGNRFPYGVMVVELKYANPALIAVPNHLALERLAQVLNDNGVTVTLSGWGTSAASGSPGAGGPT